MQYLHDGVHVWLRCRERGTYLYALEDGERISLCSERASRNAAWKVQVFYQPGMLMFLQSAAYGRYLAATDLRDPAGHPGLLTAQRDFVDDQNVEPIMWLPIVFTGAENADSIMSQPVCFSHLLRTVFRYLQANGGYLPWMTSVTIDHMYNLNPMMYWVVEPIPPRVSPPPIPCPHPSPDAMALLELTAEEHWRKIRYVRPRDDGVVNEDDWVEFDFSGWSVLNLRSELALRLEMEEDETAGITMCVRAGRYARLTPLVVDLPVSGDPLDIVILMAGDPAIAALQHPNVDFTGDGH